MLPVWLGSGCPAVAAATSSDVVYDLVISGGRVIDPETGFDASAKVGVKGDSIAVISQMPLSGSREIDATGHAVTAGFIDQHFH